MGLIATRDGIQVRYKGRIVREITRDEIKALAGTRTDRQREGEVEALCDAEYRAGEGQTVKIHILDRATGDFAVNQGPAGRTLEPNWWENP